ncbi:prolyl 4-hydroxylase subunit alpha-2 [Drosophila innubila]|uniref:prolyl 4-hydroxylase subunit alpha-2 n=1 Tax=Drosophila innubila TaxID=198719 RepID=UPI00148D7924|nr:prolyl 4-hydroxylase subunit alpha-2 [Drosophila innubila]
MKYLNILAIVLHLAISSAEFFSSTSSLEQLLRTEVILLSELQNYVNEIKEHAELLQSEIDAIKAEHLSASDSIEGYLNNPVNAFRLIKRLHSDWETFESNVENEASRINYLEAIAGHRENLSYPTKEDFVGTALALTRLQQTYQLDVGELASGMLNGVKYGAPMSWQDCFVLGQHLYELRDYNNTVPWLQQSMQLLVQQHYAEESASLDFMEAVVSYHQAMGDYQNALSLINHVLSVQPEQRLHLLQTRFQLEQLIRDGVKRGLMHEVMRSPGDYHASREYQLYQQVCRQELTPTSSAQRELRCRLHSRLAYVPYKLEELHLDPYVVQVHDVISPKDSIALQKLARPELQRSQVYTLGGSDPTSANFRTSKGTSFHYGKHPAMQRLRQHMSTISELNMNSAELLQIANYGIGGHYEPHMDSFDETHDYSQDVDSTNRLATGIFYLSDVEAGGGTAFPFLPLLVTPERGSLLFWYNLHPSGDQDYRTKHAGCPVLHGSKWIANVWIRLRHQDQVRPCKLERNHEISLPYKNYS